MINAEGKQKTQPIRIVIAKIEATTLRRGSNVFDPPEKD
jgi:hypothetical protein